MATSTGQYAPVLLPGEPPSLTERPGRPQSAAAAAKSRQSCPTVRPQTAAHQAPPSLGFSSKNTAVGCRSLRQCMNVKSESELAQSCPTLSDPTDCSPAGRVAKSRAGPKRPCARRRETSLIHSLICLCLWLLCPSGGWVRSGAAAWPAGTPTACAAAVAALSLALRLCSG